MNYVILCHFLKIYIKHSPSPLGSGRSPLVQRQAPTASPGAPSQGMPNVRKIVSLTPYQNK